MPIIPALGRHRQGDEKFKVILSCISESSLSYMTLSSLTVMGRTENSSEVPANLEERFRFIRASSLLHIDPKTLAHSRGQSQAKSTTRDEISPWVDPAPSSHQSLLVSRM